MAVSSCDFFFEGQPLMRFGTSLMRLEAAQLETAQLANPGRNDRLNLPERSPTALAVWHGAGAV